MGCPMKKTVPIIWIVWFAWWPVKVLGRWTWMKKVVWEEDDAGNVHYGIYNPGAFPTRINFCGWWTRDV